MNRGSWIHTDSVRTIYDCFNEAPIHESGKSESTFSAAPRAVRSFNEAPIHESGKSRLRLRNA